MKFRLPLLILFTLSLSACPSDEQDTTAKASPTPKAIKSVQPKKLLSPEIVTQKSEWVSQMQNLSPYALKAQAQTIRVYKDGTQLVAIEVSLNQAKRKSTQLYYLKNKRLFLFEEKGVLIEGEQKQSFELSLSWDIQGQIQDVIYYKDGQAKAVPSSQIQKAKARAQNLLEQDSPPKVFKGLVTQEGQGIRFHPCRSLGSHRLNAPGLLPRFSQHELLPGEPMFLSFEGHLKDREYQLKKTKSFHPWKPDGSCFQLDFLAEGTHPDWSLTFLKDKQVFFKAFEGEFPAVEHFAYSAPKKKDNTWRYTLQMLSGPQSQIKVMIEKKDCQLKGKILPYQVQVRYFEIHYSGCAQRF